MLHPHQALPILRRIDNPFPVIERRLHLIPTVAVVVSTEHLPPLQSRSRRAHAVPAIVANVDTGFLVVEAEVRAFLNTKPAVVHVAFLGGYLEA